MRFRGQSGQTLLIAVMIGMILLISIPVIVFLTQVGSRHQMASQKRTKGRAIAEAGISYATQQLSQSSMTWVAALNNSFDGTWPTGGALATDCNTGTLIPSPSGGGSFKLTCSVDSNANPGLQPYQVSVISVAYLQDQSTGTASTAERAIQAYLSERTLGVDLATGLHAAAALVLVSTPNYLSPLAAAGPLKVNWGPIVILDTTTTTLNGDLDQVVNGGGPNTFQGYPRKFSLGGITGPQYVRAATTTASAATTDRKEYWAFASQTFPPLINEDYYIAQATGVTTGFPVPNYKGSGLPVPTCTTVANCTTNTGCGCFEPVGDTAWFNGVGSLPSGSTVYVNGDAEFDNINADNVAVIVTGKLTLGTPPSAGTYTKTLRGPNTALLEYPYWHGNPWPCESRLNPYINLATCGSASNPDSPFIYSASADKGDVPFRGFLYVKDNLIVTQPLWNLVGSVQVGDRLVPGGQLTINSLATLFIAYDDIINHNIQVNPVSGISIKVVPDVLQDVSPR